MRCHYIKVKEVGRVLIPGCMAVAVTGDIERCTCHPTTYKSFEREDYNREVKRLKGIIQELEKENERLLRILERNDIKEDTLLK